MAKEKSVFVCNNCGGEHLAWQGKCQFCSEWNTLKEFKISHSAKASRDKQNLKVSEVVDLRKIESKDFKRIPTRIGEFDRVLGGGLVPGSVILLGGDPGIGKSTLLLQCSNNLASTNDILYVSGEESANQVKMRLDRLPNKAIKLNFLAETDIDKIISKLNSPTVEQNSKIIIIDSIQTMYDSNFPSTPGSVVQVRECALRLQQFAKENDITIILVGHMTKDGNVAGPKTLEHLVDVVLYLEGERFHSHRILRGVKNRFGATDEIGIFEMSQDGLNELSDPSQLFLEERSKDKTGSVVTATIEGTRPIMVEIQALTARTVFGYPKRTVSGFDLNRLNLLIAVLSKKLNLSLDNQDIYVNVVGGFKLKDPAIDLAVCGAIISSFKNKSIESKLCLFGEVGLTGEIRKTSQESKRTNEAKRLGFEIVSCKSIDELVNKIIK
jgi:DNA repair protein RadA/Sms